MEGTDFDETFMSIRMGRASRVPPGDSCRDNYEQESQLPSSSGQPTEIERGNILDHYGGRPNEHHSRPLEVDGVKHKIFLSHSGAQKDFVEQLCVDVERGGSIAPFFDQRDHSLPKGKDFVPLIKEAAQHCHVAVMVLSEEYLCSKWPMIELAEFHAAQQGGNQRLNMLPLFYKLSVKDVDERAIEERWMPRWRELANDDKRIDVAKWREAVRALRKVNGLEFGQKGVSEVAYRKDIVRSIFKLSPPELLYGSSRSMVGYNRICKMMCDEFVRGTSGGPSVLGFYGTSGAGKTTLSKALCDHFSGEYMGRVCHVELGGSSRMGRACPVDLNEMWRLRQVQLERVKWLLERLCGLDKDVLDSIRDFAQGLMLMRMHMKREPVFLAIDDVTNDSSSSNEAREYLRAGFHPGSRIVITSRSISNIQDLVPDIQFCVPMPRLSVTEAGELFLRSAAPSKSIFELTVEELRVVGLCIRQCLLLEADQCEDGCASDEDEVGFVLQGDVRGAREGRYHPVALSALGDFFCRYFSNADMLGWRDHLEEKKDPLWELWKEPNGIGRIIGLQFHSLLPSEQLLFLDIAAFGGLSMNLLFLWEPGNVEYLKWLCDVHEETQGVMERRLQDLERSGMIIFDMNFWGESDLVRIRALDIYERFAEWYVTNHGVKWLKNAWCVFETRGSTLNQAYVASDLVRLRMFDLTRASARLLASERIQELDNLEVLQILSCPLLRKLNLEGLETLRGLELMELRNLVALTSTRSEDLVKSGGIFKSLKYVVLVDLDSLVHGPDVRLCTFLHMYVVWSCPSMTNLDEMECPQLKHLELRELVADQLKRLPNVSALRSLEFFFLSTWCTITLSDVEASRGIGLRDLDKPYLRVVEELFLYLHTEWVSVDYISGEKTEMSVKWVKRNPLSEYVEWRDSSGSWYSWR